MTEQEKETKKHREEAIKALKEMRDMMMGAFAIARLNRIDYGKAESEE